MVQGYQPQADQITRTEYLCKHCGSWINSTGIMDDKHRTSRGTYCKYCNTAEKRREIDKENAEIRKGGEKK